MNLALYPSFFFIVVLLVTTAYFLMGGLPLLVLDHDTPLDGRFIRRFFEVYYKAALFATGGATLSFALWGRWGFAIGTAVMAAVALALRRRVLPAMQHLTERIHEAEDKGAIRTFRKVHSAALLVNLTQLVVLVWGVLHISV